MPKTFRPMTSHPITVRELEVVRAVDVTPGMRRVTLTGAQLAAFTSSNGLAQPAFVSPGFDDAIRLIFAYPGESEPVLPIQLDGRTAFPKGRRPLSKAYSVRRWDPEAAELDIDFVKHGVGVATTWAYRAQPGDRIHLGGPSSSRGLPTEADWLLALGDETALPAIGRLLDELPETARARVFVEVAEQAHVQSLGERPGVELTWLVRDGAPAGDSTLLLAAVRELSWPDGNPFAWIAGEQAVVRDLRRYLLEERGMAKTDVETTGYWRQSTVVTLAGDAAVPDQEKTTAAFDTFHDLAELIPPIAIRVAVSLGIGDLISRGVTGTAELAARTGSDQRALGKLLRYLTAIDVLTETAPEQHGLTEVGEFMATELWIDILGHDGAVGRQHLGIFGLAESVRTGGASYASVTGQDFAALRAEQWYEDRYLDKIAGFVGFLAEPLARSSALAGVDHLVLHTDGAGVQAREVTAVHPQLQVTICALPAQADWLRRDLAESVPEDKQRDRISIAEQSIFEPTPPADAVLIVKALGALADADAAYALRRAAENLSPGGRVLLIEDVLDAAELDEHETEADLFALTRDGTGLRTEAELGSVIEQAGLRTVATHTVGWGNTLRELTVSG